MTKKKKNGWIFWNFIAGLMLAVSLIVHYWIVDVRVAAGYFTAPSWVINVDNISGGLVNAILIGWIAGNIIAKTKK